MRTSWADSEEAEATAAPSTITTNGVVADSGNATAAAAAVNSRPTRSAYVPPHLRNRPPSSTPPPPAVSAPPPANSRWSGSGGRSGGSSSFGRTASNTRTGGWDRGREREVNPFGDDVDAEPPFDQQENSGINFDAYEDIPVDTSGDNVPPPVNAFSEIDLGDALNLNIRRCKYVKPTPVQRHAIPISIAGRDLMACAQTGSGKTAAFCFPIISGIMSGQYAQRSRGSRTAYPLALILSPTRELSCQVFVDNQYWCLPCLFMGIVDVFGCIADTR